jgi:hypothetical protein
LSIINGYELRLTGIIERDAQEGHSFPENKSQQTNGNDLITIPITRQQELGIIRYICDGIESRIQYLPSNVSNTSVLYCGDKVRLKEIYLKIFISNFLGRI